ncbi:MAG: ribbon-helix-helix domain-containing protein [Desulfurococcales archaeon]|nr:ribbon-helix-helix domain-containing protein [Desulfurococcales archaeon]
MVVSVEISGILEERLRRLVDLGIYATVAEAVREAVRDFLRKVDLKDIAFNLYVSRGASFQYVAEFTGETFDALIDYFISRGVIPLIGVSTREDLVILEPGPYVLDGLTVYVAYKAGLVDAMVELRELGYRFIAPRSVEGLVELLEAKRLAQGLLEAGVVEFMQAKPSRAPSDLVSAQEASAVALARSRGFVLLSDDSRTRGYARSRGVRAYSLASLISTLWSIGREPVEDYVYSYKSVPALLPEEMLRSLMGLEERVRGERA